MRDVRGWVAEANVTETQRQRWETVILGSGFALVAVLIGVDLLADWRAGTSLAHAATEGATVLLGVAGAVWMGVRLTSLGRQARQLEQQASSLAQHLEASRAEAERWRTEVAGLLAGVSAAIDAQLTAWGLTPAEKEVALLLLKGLSHKEIGELRGVSEATVRQQARALYAKAGLSGRSDLAAFFLEDMLQPRAAGAQEPGNEPKA